MHLSSHTWMRPEPLEHTLKRLSRLGYSSIELAGEPDIYPIQETRQLLDQYNIQCWGTVTIQHGTRDLTAADPQQRRATVQYMKDVVLMCAELGGKIVTVVPGRVGKLVPTSTPENEWKWAVEGLREVAALAREKNIRIGLEPLNRFATFFLNRTEQALALADEVGYGCGIAFDPFHIAFEEKDLFSAIRSCGSRIVDFHVADSNRFAAGDGSFDWCRIMSVLAEAGYDGGLAVECMPPIDRTPVGNFGAAQLETEAMDVLPEQLQFIIDHGSGVFSDAYYTELLRKSAETMRPFLD
jgi:D-psicose/D-tagatose/L-ribulose 3-epimerase